MVTVGIPPGYRGKYGIPKFANTTSCSTNAHADVRCSAAVSRIYLLKLPNMIFEPVSFYKLRTQKILAWTCARSRKTYGPRGGDRAGTFFI